MLDIVQHIPLYTDTPPRSRRQKLVLGRTMQRFLGTVVGTAMKKTIKVCVERLVKHQKYQRVMRLKKNYLVHDPHELAVIGDMVAIEYCGKISRRKAFNLTEILLEARRFQHPVTGQVFTAPAAQAPAANWKELLGQ